MKNKNTLGMLLVFIAAVLWSTNSILVQIPCIERNAYAAVRAMDSSLYSALTDGRHSVSFDKVVKVMKQTGHDLPSVYKETSEGGLASHF